MDLGDVQQAIRPRTLGQPVHRTARSTINSKDAHATIARTGASMQPISARLQKCGSRAPRPTPIVAWLGALFSLIVCGSEAPAQDAAGPNEPATCQVVRLSDIGWTDVTATTALFSNVLHQLGYEPKVTVLSVPVTFASMKNKDIDVFLGNWMPSQLADRKPFDEDKSVDVIGANLTGAKYTLAAPAYTYAAGLHDFADITRFAPQLSNSIYGIEPGNDGNRLILTIIKQNQFGLGSFKLIESSEQGMLAEVERAIRDRRPIV